MRNIGSIIWRSPRNILYGLVLLYQKTLSPDHSPLRHAYPYGFCRHEPTCSEYSKRALRKHGAIMGTILTGKRVINCTPWSTPDDARMMRAIDQQMNTSK